MRTFEHTSFKVYELAELPLHEDIYMMDEVCMDKWEAARLDEFRSYYHDDADDVGYISHVKVSAVTAAGAELSWFSNVYDRFHQVKTFLPKEAFVAAALTHKFDRNIHLFVKSDWLVRLHLRSNSIFAIIDAVDMTEAIQSGAISHRRVIGLRARLDELATKHLDICFISFADSLLLKTNWTAGMVDTDVTYTYRPEALLLLFRELQAVYRESLALEIYGVFAQGSNEYYDDPLLHISSSQNHISLNSLGLPFAQISLIEAAARRAIRAGEHPSSEIYVDKDLFNSLRFRDWEQKSKWPCAGYMPKMTTEPGIYFYAQVADLLDALQL